MNLSLVPYDEPQGGMYFDADRPGSSVFTARFGPDGEEIDVLARDRHEARRIALAAAERDYGPMSLREVVGPRVGFFL